MKLFEYNS